MGDENTSAETEDIETIKPKGIHITLLITIVLLIFVIIILLFATGYINYTPPTSLKCSSGNITQGNTCISKYSTDGKNATFNYVLQGSNSSINYKVYKGLDDYLASLPRTIHYIVFLPPPTTKDFIFRDLNQVDQQELITSLVNDIKNITNNTDDQARIAVSLVQNIPYGNPLNVTFKYPYEVLYTDSGVCGEKSELLSLLLKDLGYGVVIFNYPTDNHQAVGIKCPSQYSLGGSGYCFIETTVPSIITDNNGNYPCGNGVGKCKLSNNYSIIQISNGTSFDSVSEEYNDSIAFENLTSIGEQNNGYLLQDQYSEWQSIVKKYGIQTSS